MYPVCSEKGTGIVKSTIVIMPTCIETELVLRYPFALSGWYCTLFIVTVDDKDEKNN